MCRKLRCDCKDRRKKDKLEVKSRKMRYLFKIFNFNYNCINN